jgi:uncharacterized protein with GYD domain
MPKYMFECKYVGDGITGLLKDGGSKRRAVVEKLFKSRGGKIEAYYYAFGETDLIIIADVPNNAVAATTVLAVTSTQMIQIKTTVLLSAEELDGMGEEIALYTTPGHQIPRTNG